MKKITALLILFLASPLVAEYPNTSGVTVHTGLTHYDYEQSAALGYKPLGLGYRWASGFAVSTQMDLFFYVGEERDETKLKDFRYEFNMLNWINEITYSVQLPLNIKPFVGTSLELVSGEKTPRAELLTGGGETRVIASKAEPAWNMIGASAILGLGWQYSDRWMLIAQGRYIFPLSGGFRAPISVGLGINFLM